MSHSRIFVVSFGDKPDESRIGCVDVDTLYDQMHGAADYTDNRNGDGDYEDDLYWLSSIWGVDPDYEDKCDGKTVRGFSLSKLKDVLKDRMLNQWKAAEDELKKAKEKLLDDEYYDATMAAFEVGLSINDKFGFYFYVDYPETEQAFVLDTLLPNKEERLWILETFDYHY